MSTVISNPTEVSSEVSRLIAVLEDFFVYASTGKSLAAVNIAAGVALEELRSVKDSLSK
jgi:hypothetical protein